MKKQILLLAFSLFALCGFSQRFQYELKKWEINGTLIDNKDGTSSQPIIVTVGIVDEPYGFVAANPQKNMFSVIISNKYGDIEKMTAYIDEQAAAWVKKNYPDAK